MTDGTEVHVFRFGGSQVVHFLHARRQEMVIEDGLDGRKTFQSHHFFAIEFAIRFFELCMTFVGNFSEFMIKRHVYSYGLI